MRLVSDADKLVQRKMMDDKACIRQAEPRDVCIKSMVDLISNIVETACERESDLDLIRLINFMDLYRVYVQLGDDPGSEPLSGVVNIHDTSDAALMQNLGETKLVSFERFVRDSHLLCMAARAASRETGDTVATPSPLSISANDMMISRVQG